MIGLLKHVGLTLLIGWVPWTGLSALISWGFNVDFSTVYLIVGLIYLVVLFCAVWKFKSS